MKFYLEANYHSSELPFLERAAHECGAELLAVGGVALSDLPAQKPAAGGKYTCLFAFHASSKLEAGELVYSVIPARVRALYLSQLSQEGHNPTNEGDRGTGCHRAGQAPAEPHPP